MTKKVAACDHFLNKFLKKNRLSIKETNNFECVCSNTFTHLILVCNQRPGKICSCGNEENQKHFCVTCMLKFLNFKMKKICFSNEAYGLYF